MHNAGVRTNTPLPRKRLQNFFTQLQQLFFKQLHEVLFWLIYKRHNAIDSKLTATRTVEVFSAGMNPNGSLKTVIDLTKRIQLNLISMF